jgi:CRP-like cAMP-binding protein
MARSLQPVRFANRLLASLPASEQVRLEPALKRVQLRPRQILHEPLAPIRHAYFIEQGLVAVVNPTSDGSTIEVAAIGNEGMTGHSIMLDVDSMPQRYVVQLAGSALQMPTAALRAEMNDHTALRRVLHRYHAAFVNQVMQGATCHGLHSIQQRCCRWLLQCLDRTSLSEVIVTHELLAQMLGVRRASISEVLKPLQASGLIRNRRGIVAVLDREGLEQSACECHRTIDTEFQRVSVCPS